MCRENNFKYQAKEILIRALQGYDLECLNNIEDFQEEIWEQDFAAEIGRKFMEVLSEYNSDDTYIEVMEELQEAY